MLQGPAVFTGIVAKKVFGKHEKIISGNNSFDSRLVHPKSPDVEALLSSGLEVKPEQGDKQEGKSLSLQFGDFSEVTPCTVVKTPELEAYLEVPWEVPKLRKKLQSRKKIPPQEFMQGSDSGISMSSQETREVAPWLQPPKLRRRLELEGGGCSQAPAARVERQQRAGSGSEGESRRSLCLSQPSSSSVAANAEFLVQSYPGPRPASMVSASLGLGCRSATEGGGEGAAEEVKLGEDRLEEGETVGNGESFQPPPDISDLPFSMPKLARRLGQAPSSPPLKLFRQPASQSLSLNISPPDLGSCVSQPCSPTFPGAKPLKSRPMSLVQPNNQAGPQLNLPLHSRPGEKTSLPNIFKLHVFQGLLPLAGSATGPFGCPDSSVDPLDASAMLTDNAAGLFGGSAPASAVPTRKKPLLFLAPSRYCRPSVSFNPLRQKEKTSSG